MKQNKAKTKRKSSVLLLFFTFAIILVGIVLANVLAVVIKCMFTGFSDFIPAICDLPYLLYLIFSLVISIVLALIMNRKIKS